MVKKSAKLTIGKSSILLILLPFTLVSFTLADNGFIKSDNFKLI